MSDVFAKAVKNNRDKLNTKFAYARHAYPSLDGEAFLEHLRLFVAPVIEAVEKVATDQTEETLVALYDISLDLVGKGLMGAESRYPALVKGWNQLFHQFGHLLAQDPLRFAGAVTNALFNLSSSQNTRPTYWIDEMLRIGPACSDAKVFLEVGKVVAWRSGMAHFREGALDACLHLDAELACESLCIKNHVSTDIKALVERLRRDPWLSPWTALRTTTVRQVKVVSVVGAFRGFGGLFVSLPEVVSSNGDFYVFDNQNCWLMTADLFGATLHRIGATLPELDAVAPAGFKIDKSGQVSGFEQKAQFYEFANPSSSAANETTLAVTLPVSFGVYLIALSAQ